MRKHKHNETTEEETTWRRTFNGGLQIDRTFVMQWHTERERERRVLSDEPNIVEVTRIP
jgi:hypothetical protein